jgi:hypothetical protein
VSRQWVAVDDWLRFHEEQPPPRQLCLRLPPAPPVQRESPVRFRWPQPPDAPGPWRELGERLDQVVAELRRQGRKQAGRRAALLANIELADDVYQLIRERGVDDVVRGLSLSRQALYDAWHRHGWTAPFGSGNQQARRTS